MWLALAGLALFANSLRIVRSVACEPAVFDLETWSVFRSTHPYSLRHPLGYTVSEARSYGYRVGATAAREIVVHPKDQPLRITATGELKRTENFVAIAAWSCPRGYVSDCADWSASFALAWMENRNRSKVLESSTSVVVRGLGGFRSTFKDAQLVAPFGAISVWSPAPLSLSLQLTFFDATSVDGDPVVIVVVAPLETSSSVVGIVSQAVRPTR